MTPSYLPRGKGSFSTRWVVPVTVFVLVFATAAFFEWTDWQRRYEDHRSHQQALLSRVDTMLSSELHQALGQLQGMADWVALNPEASDAEFDRYSQRLLSHHPMLRSTTLLPGDRIRRTYPPDDRLVGMDVGQHPDQGEAVRAMVELHRPVVAGPVALAQGGVAFVLRAPVWIEGQTPRYFGHVSVVVDLARLNVLLQGLSDELGMSLALVDRNGNNARSGFQIGERIRGDDDIVSTRIAVLGSAWELRAQDHARPTFPNSWLRLSMEALFALLAALGARLLAVMTSRLRQQNRLLNELATTDPLTGIANRRVLLDACENMFALSRRTDTELSVLMLDLDRFKLVNDTHGHRAGDAVLCHIAGLLKATLRGTDVLGRWGGEEFLMLAPGTGREGALQLAERILNAIRHSPAITSVGPLSITASIGIATLSRDDASTLGLIERADQALYAAKTSGRDRAIAHENNPEQIRPHGLKLVRE